MDLLHEKKERLVQYFRELGSVAIAFSSGVDSTFMLKVAYDTLGDRCIAVTALPHSFPKREAEEAAEFCQKLGVKHYHVSVNELEIEGFKENPPNRCYLCKKVLFTEIMNTAKAQGINYVAEGSNMDDLGDYRPGLQAIAELGIKSPLRAAELYKQEIRDLSKELDLPTWSKPSFACLSTRLPYGEEITEEKLQLIDQSEQLLLDLGLHQYRVRIHGKLARIEVFPEEFDLLMKHAAYINEKFQEFGFLYVTLDLGGFKSGNMNKVLVK